MSNKKKPHVGDWNRKTFSPIEVVYHRTENEYGVSIGDGFGLWLLANEPDNPLVICHVDDAEGGVAFSVDTALQMIQALSALVAIANQSKPEGDK